MSELQEALATKGPAEGEWTDVSQAEPAPLPPLPDLDWLDEVQMPEPSSPSPEAD